MEWTAEVAAGDWIRERTDVPWRGTMHDVVPRGFPAYARVFHPATRDRPVGDAWPGLPYAKHRREWDAFQQRDPQITDERVTWAETAAAMGTTMHALAQWHRIVAPGRIVENEDGPRDAAGWRYADPEQGDLAPDLVTAIASHLAAHTTAPGDGFVALWEGSGGLVGFFGESPSRVFFQLGEPESGEIARHNEILGRSLKDQLNNAFRAPTWQEGILSRTVSEGERLELPARSHVLFRGGISELADADWILHVPWRDRVGAEHGFPPDAQAPTLVWPADRAWVLVTEVDFDSTVIGGPPGLVAAVCADLRLEALPLPAESSLGWDADEVNR